MKVMKLNDKRETTRIVMLFFWGPFYQELFTGRSGPYFVPNDFSLAPLLTHRESVPQPNQLDCMDKCVLCPVVRVTYNNNWRGQTAGLRDEGRYIWMEHLMAKQQSEDWTQCKDNWPHRILPASGGGTFHNNLTSWDWIFPWCAQTPWSDMHLFH